MTDLFSKLSNELMDKVLSHGSAEDLARARLVSSRFREPAGRLLFRRLTFWHTPKSAKDVASVIASKHLRAYVREFCFAARTSQFSIDENAFPRSADALPAQVLDTLRRVSLLDNLTALRCSHASVTYPLGENEPSVVKFETYRGEVHKTLIVSLAERAATLRKLEKLDMDNLPCRSQPDLTDRPSFSALLRTLQTLLLRFDYDPAYHQPYGNYPLGGVSHEFFTRLPQAWLEPAAANLTCLSLSAPELWGYLLKVDFRDVHFLRLTSLVMKYFVFSHDWQLEWIRSHTSLQKLCLIQCPILTHARWYGEKDDEGYIISWSISDTRPLQDYWYDRSWHHYYQQFERHLMNLSEFTTKPDDEGVVANLIDPYERFDLDRWVEVTPEPDMEKEDKRKLKQLKATAKRRSRH